MIQQKDIFLDKDFLTALSQQKNREIFARLTALDMNELPVDRINGKITSGSINIDGDSSVRRTCNLTFVSQNININDYYWGIKTKFKLEIGLKNNLLGKYQPSENYPEIVWFSEGYYIISTFNTSINTNSCTISITGKDKMCLLNGDLGGQIYAQVDFGAEELEETIMEEIAINEDNQPKNSEEILKKDYYIEEKEASSISIGKVFSSSCLLISDREKGIYYREKNVFKMVNDSDNKDMKKKYYRLYKKIEDISKCFKSKTFSNDDNYKANKYYYEDPLNPQYYILDTNETKDDNKNYYELAFSAFYHPYTTITKTKIPIKKIIREAVHTYANEPYHNIVIKDLDDYGLEQLTYKGDIPLYALYSKKSEEFVQLFLADNNNPLKDIIKTNTFDFMSINEEAFSEGTPIYYDEQNSKYTTDKPQTEDFPYYVLKIEYGMDIGYRLTDLVYAGDLISNIGESFTSTLEKIKEMLETFEYFYDNNGKFIFQKKKNYIKSLWQAVYQEDKEDPILEASKDYFKNFKDQKTVFNFEGNTLISAISNTPSLNNLRNDFSVWGKRKTLSDAEVPIHVRYAIDKKPVYYKALDGTIYISEEYKEDSEDKKVVDWREIIYQMAMDYFKGQGCSEKEPVYLDEGTLTSPDDFLFEIGSRNKEYYPTGYTGYEQYYTDLQGYWRQLYNPDYVPELIYTSGSYTINNEQKRVYNPPTIKDCNIEYYNNDPYLIWNIINDAYLEADEGSEEEKRLLELRDKYEKYNVDFLYDLSLILGQINLYEDENTELRKTILQSLYILRNKYNYLNKNDEIISLTNKVNQYLLGNIPNNPLEEYIEKLKEKHFYNERLYWNINVFEDPSTLDFWFDFLDSDTELAQFAVPEVGIRSMTINENSPTAVIHTSIPDLIFYTDEEKDSEDWKEQKKELERQSGAYTPIHLPVGYEDFFTISSRHPSLKNKLDELLYQHSYCIENVSITTIPIYDLEPNTRIFVCDKNTHIEGEYIVNKITIPLSYNGLMSITAYKAPQEFY